jgi:hypothetical protein
MGLMTGDSTSPWRLESVFKDLLLLEDLVNRFKEDVEGVRERVGGLFGRVLSGCSGPSEVRILIMRIGILHGIPLAKGMMCR